MLFQAIVLCSVASAGFERNVQPASVFSKAFSGVASYSFDNMLLNPASGASISSFQTTMFYSPSPFQVPQLSQYGMLAGNPFSFGSISFGINTTGFSLYRETNGTVSYAGHMTNEFSGGISLHFFHVSIQDYGASTSIGFDLGGIYTPSEFLSIGFSLANVNGADFGNGEEIPRSVTAGITIRPLPATAISFDLVKDLRFKETYRIGMEFSPHEVFTINVGVQGDPSRLFGGFGIILSPFMIRYGIGTHTDLGLSHLIGISFVL